LSRELRAGAAAISIAPPLGVDMMGYLRRSEPARGYGAAMEATALVLDGDERVVLLGGDLVGASGAWAQEVRERIGSAVGTPADHVLINSQHTHAAPPTTPAGRRSAATGSGIPRSSTTPVSSATCSSPCRRRRRAGCGRRRSAGPARSRRG
jgi:hypothetical protein